MRALLRRWILWPRVSHTRPLSAEEVDEWREYLYRRCALWNRFAARQRQCPLCGWSGWTYLPFVHNIYIRRGAACPKCGALERHRAFTILLRRELSRLPAGKALEVSPVFEFGFKSLFLEAGWEYLSLDIEPGKADIQGDICELPFSQGEFDAIVCFHVLEHVPDDRKALRELRRCLKSGGMLFLAVPWKADSLTREFAAPDPLLHGHVRHYGRDVKERIAEAGFQVEVKDCGELLSDKELRRWGIQAERGDVLLCR